MCVASARAVAHFGVVGACMADAHCRGQKLLPSRRLQFTAILLLVILLFPVISVTDDIAMCTAPRDAERALRLHDPFDSSQPTPALLPSTMAWMDTISSHAADWTWSSRRTGRYVGDPAGRDGVPG